MPELRRRRKPKRQSANDVFKNRLCIVGVFISKYMKVYNYLTHLK